MTIFHSTSTGAMIFFGEIPVMKDIHNIIGISHSTTIPMDIIICITIAQIKLQKKTHTVDHKNLLLRTILSSEILSSCYP